MIRSDWFWNGDGDEFVEFDPFPADVSFESFESFESFVTFELFESFGLVPAWLGQPLSLCACGLLDGHLGECDFDDWMLNLVRDRVPDSDLAATAHGDGMSRIVKINRRQRLIGEGHCTRCPVHDGENYVRRDVRFVAGRMVDRKGKERK